MKALVVDDSRAMRMFVAKPLRGLGFEIAEAGDGAQALELLRADAAIGLALVDWHMPQMDGLSLVQAVRADPARAGLRILMVTSVAEREQIARALEAGADDYIMKPFTAHDLLTRLVMMGIG